MSNHRLINIKRKVLTPLLASLVLIMATVFWNIYRHQQSESLILSSTANQQLQQLFQDALEQETERLTGFNFFIQNNIDLRNHWINKDRPKLQAASTPIFRHLRHEYQVTHLYFHRLDGSILLRVHAPEKHDDFSDRSTLEHAMLTGTTSAGIEFGTFGQFVLRVVMPWKLNGKIVGYIELGEEMDHILQRLARANHYDLILSVNKSFLVSERLLDTPYFKSQEINVDEQQNQIITTKTTASIDPDIIKAMNQYPSNGAVQIEKNLKNHLISQIPVEDFSGRSIGQLTYIADISQTSYLFKQFVQTLAISLGILALLITAFFLSYSRKFQHHLRNIYEKMNSEIESRKKAEKSLIEKSQTLEEVIEARDDSLTESRRRYKTLFEKSADALLIIEGHQFIDCNQATLDMLGYANKQQLYQTHPSALSPEFQSDGQTSAEKANIMIETAFDKGSHRFEWDHKRKNGEVFPVEVLLTAIPDRNQQLLHVVWRDITERRKAAKEIEFQALYDSLTNLPNRRLLFDRINQSIITARHHNYFNALLFLDIDHFKNINDSLGHSIGDTLLIETAKRIQNCLSKEDTASRFGGDEFVILIHHAGQDRDSASITAEKIALRLKEAMAAPLFIEQHEFHITVSIGANLFPSHDECIDDIIKHADTAMYSAKEAGRNRIQFYLSDMQDKVVQRLHLERDLRRAVKEEELQVYYQPQYNQAGEIVSVEALARWIHETQGFISPEEFIALAEETNIIFDLGSFILRRALTDISALNLTRERKIGLAVNISQKQFDKEGFINEVRDLIGNFSLARNELTLEVTEGLAINNLNQTIEKFETLRHLGVRMSLDDFGTGYSSLSYLHAFPINTLKIDQSFVRDMHKNESSLELVRSIVSLGKNLNMEIVAEGVEQIEEARLLKNMGCDYAQGYYFAKPMSENDVIDLVSSWEKIDV